MFQNLRRPCFQFDSISLTPLHYCLILISSSSKQNVIPKHCCLLVAQSGLTIIVLGLRVKCNVGGQVHECIIRGERIKMCFHSQSSIVTISCKWRASAAWKFHASNDCLMSSCLMSSWIYLDKMCQKNRLCSKFMSSKL